MRKILGYFVELDSVAESVIIWEVTALSFTSVKNLLWTSNGWRESDAKQTGWFPIKEQEKSERSALLHATNYVNEKYKGFKVEIH